MGEDSPRSHFPSRCTYSLNYTEAKLCPTTCLRLHKILPNLLQVYFYKSDKVKKGLALWFTACFIIFYPFLKIGQLHMFDLSPPNRRTGTVTRWWSGEALQSDQCLIYLLFLSHNQTVYSMYFVQYLATYCVVHEQ